MAMLRGIILHWNLSINIQGFNMQIRKYWNIKTLLGISASVALTVFVYQHHAHDVKLNQIIANTPIANPPTSMVSAAKIQSSVHQPDNNLAAWQGVLVHSGDTLGHIFRRLKVKQSDFVYLSKHYQQISSLHPKSTIYFRINPDHSLSGFKYPIDAAKTLIIERHHKNFVSTIQSVPTTMALSFKSTIIHRSLSKAAAEAGITKAMLSQLQLMFSNSINFKKDIKSGDRLSFLYQSYFLNGKHYRDGAIVAAELNTANKNYRMVRYQYAQSGKVAYYTPEGKGTEPRFLSAPLHYKRISSYFIWHRFDPILHEVRPHLGIDFAANVGTPIKSIGDGRIVYIGKEGGFGQIIKIRYDKHIVALYAHMQHFAKNISMFKHVAKGEVIGYVGKTGWATGPHLHFGYYVDGKPVNWLAVKMPSAATIPSHYKKRFLAFSRQLFAELQMYQDTRLAVNNQKIVKHPRY